MTESLSIYKEHGKWHGRALRALMDSLPDGNYTVTMANAAKRSTDQNDRVHTLCRIIANALNEMQATGPQIHRWTMEDVKEWCIADLAPTLTVVDPNGVIHERRMRTHEMSMAESSEFMDAVESYFAREFGVIVPENGEQTEIQL